jgi:FkbM family methyltransferase
MFKKIMKFLTKQFNFLKSQKQQKQENLGEDSIQLYRTRQRFILTDLIASILPKENGFQILDAGARDAFADPRWNACPPERTTLFGFECDDHECKQLNARANELGRDYRYYPLGLWSAPGELTLIENKSSGGNSMFLQNTRLTNRWKFENAKDKFYAKEIFYPTGETTVKTVSVMDWAKANKVEFIDFCKINVQAAELEILKGMGNLLDSVLGMQVEVSFVESYLKRPMFSDIDQFVRENGFVFFDFIGHHCVGRADSPITAYHTPGLHPLYGQLIEGHAIYFRDPIGSNLEAELVDENVYRYLRLIALSEIYGQMEFAFETLKWVVNHTIDTNLKSVISNLYETGLARYQSILGAK